LCREHWIVEETDDGSGEPSRLIFDEEMLSIHHTDPLTSNGRRNYRLPERQCFQHLQPGSAAHPDGHANSRRSLEIRTHIGDLAGHYHSRSAEPAQVGPFPAADYCQSGIRHPRDDLWPDLVDEVVRSVEVGTVVERTIEDE
jgi:hypothetical protein